MRSPLNIGNLIKTVYMYMFVFLAFFNIKEAFSLEWVTLLNVAKYSLGLTTVLLLFVYMATNVLLGSMSQNLQSNLDKFTTAEFVQIEAFWISTRDFCRDKVINFGGIVSILVLAEFLFK